MKPYFDDGTVSLYLGDCREILPALGITADCVIADPPYGETSLEWDVWPYGWLEAVAPVSRSLWCFGSMRMFLEHGGEFTDVGWKLSQDVIWEKQNGSGFATDRFRRVHEQVAHWYRGSWSAIHHDTPRLEHTGPDKTIRAPSTRADRTPHTGTIGQHCYIDDGMRLARSVQKHASVRGGLHRTEKPLPLLRLLIAYACPRGGMVVDPAAGSGSTLEAARLLGMRAVGIEKHEPHAEAAGRRLSQMTLEAL